MSGKLCIKCKTSLQRKFNPSENNNKKKIIVLTESIYNNDDTATKLL